MRGRGIHREFRPQREHGAGDRGGLFKGRVSECGIGTESFIGRCGGGDRGFETVIGIGMWLGLSLVLECWRVVTIVCIEGVTC